MVALSRHHRQQPSRQSETTPLHSQLCAAPCFLAGTRSAESGSLIRLPTGNKKSLPANTAPIANSARSTFGRPSDYSVSHASASAYAVPGSAVTMSRMPSIGHRAHRRPVPRTRVGPAKTMSSHVPINRLGITVNPPQPALIEAELYIVHFCT